MKSDQIREQGRHSKWVLYTVKETSRMHCMVTRYISDTTVQALSLF